MYIYIYIYINGYIFMKSNIFMHIKSVRVSWIDKVFGNNMAIQGPHHNKLGLIRLENQNETEPPALVYYID